MIFKVYIYIYRERERYFQIMGAVGTLFSEENIEIIENIFKVEFEKQGGNIANLLRANLKITMDEIKKTQDEMKKLGKKSNSRKAKR